MPQRFPAKEIVAFAGQIPLFAGIHPDSLLQVVNTSEQQHFAANAVINQAGRPVAGLGLLLRGRASLVLVDATKGSTSRLEQLRPGNFFGEIGLLLGRVNPLSVVAEEESDVLIIAQSHMEKLLHGNAVAALALAKSISSRFAKLSVLRLRSVALEPSPETATPVRNSEPDDERILWVDVGHYNITDDIMSLIPSQVVLKHRLLPLELAQKKLTVGLVNPRSLEATQELRRILHSVDPHVVAISSDDFNQTIVRLKLDSREAKAKKATVNSAVPISYSVDRDKEAEKAQLYMGGEVIKLLDQILGEALDLNASDIHVEPESTGVKIRYRINGTLVDRKEFIGLNFAAPLVARIKILAELDITERRIPQDGRILGQRGRQELNFRVSTMAVARGEKAVIRVIDSANAMRPLHQIVLVPELEKAMRTSLSELYGAIVVAGPTGSGKSSTLYSMLNERRLTRPDNNIVTVEDPVEYLLQGVTQVQVVPRLKFGFAAALHGLMRQDPDVIMIGELRDPETSTIMVEAALTGHLVLTSIHGNNASAVIQRLQHLGSNPILLSQALSIVIVQRLARRLCPSCVAEAEAAPALMENLVSRGILRAGTTTRLPRAVGCDACDNSGYVGRVAVQEVLNFDEVIRSELAAGARPAELIEKARERKRFFSFAQSAAYLMARRMLSPSDALLMIAD